MSVYRSTSYAFSIVPKLANIYVAGPPLQKQIRSTFLVPQVAVMFFKNDRRYSKQRLSNNLELLSADKVKVTSVAYGKQQHERTSVLATDGQRPLVVMLAWMLARQKHLAKYAQIYMKRGYDVLTVSISPWQLLWPLKGCQPVAEEVLQFLDHNEKSQPIILHGFSVGGYVWGEVMVKMKDDLPRYQPILDRIIGQTWDSAADVTEITIGLPLAVFPNNPIMCNALGKYVGYHMRTFHDVATIHYLRASQLFHTTLVQAPALLLVSEMDPVGTASSNMRLKESWESKGIKMYWKCWEDSKHVSHFLKYKDEYTEILERFLDTLEQPPAVKEEEPHMKEKLQAKL